MLHNYVVLFPEYHKQIVLIAPEAHHTVYDLCTLALDMSNIRVKEKKDAKEPPVPCLAQVFILNDSGELLLIGSENVIPAYDHAIGNYLEGVLDSFPHLYREDRKKVEKRILALLKYTDAYAIRQNIEAIVADI